jgi:hypothetical protein
MYLFSACATDIPGQFFLDYLQGNACRTALYFSVSVIGIILTLKINELLLIVFLGF